MKDRRWMVHKSVKINSSKLSLRMVAWWWQTELHSFLICTHSIQIRHFNQMPIYVTVEPSTLIYKRGWLAKFHHFVGFHFLFRVKATVRNGTEIAQTINLNGNDNGLMPYWIYLWKIFLKLLSCFTTQKIKDSIGTIMDKYFKEGTL